MGGLSASVLASDASGLEDINVCPFGAAHAPSPIQRWDEFIFPLSKSAFAQHGVGEQGSPELRLFYDRFEICFDEPEAFGFGESLPGKNRFTAAEAQGWGRGLSWAKTQEMLAGLVEAGVLRRAVDDLGRTAPAIKPGLRPSPLPPAPAMTPRTWLECDQLMETLTGEPLELGHLELVVPVFRVAHMALDAEGRQVGEANVFPKPMRLEVPTQWQTCLFEGSRHQQALPMNVSALKAMRTHWGQMMVLLIHMREAYLDRFPEARAGWTVGHVERLSTAVLALPTWLMMRQQEPVENGALHPALSNVFRVTDGLRMIMHQMLFLPFGEPTLPADGPITAAEIHAYAERNHAFHSEYAVCAGPQTMVEEFLTVILDGRMSEAPPAPLDAEVRAALAEIEPALDYGLKGLIAYAAVYSIWPAMARTYEHLAQIGEAWGETGSPTAVRFRDRFRTHMATLKSATYLSEEALRSDREAVFADMYAQCTRGLTGAPPPHSLGERLTPVRSAASLEFKDELRGVLSPHFDQTPLASVCLQDMVEAIFDLLLRKQAVLRLAGEAQRQINAQLGRPAPKHPFSARHLNLNNRLQEPDPRRLPYLLDELESVFGIRLVTTGEELEILSVSIS